ncbi:hypothetical protein N0V82_009369 [Gnomoniopsis sp. IMI 355080]|nr:hypothetical protein N0V82_009369 [Gnomoniopsis sp. IMI 355080]
MAPPDADAQFKFLIACIKYSTAGKIDFAQVAAECEIVSKGAAAKRYERLMKAHGITGNNSGARAGSPGPSEPSTPTPRKGMPASRPSTNKKRKLAARGSDLDDEVKTEVKAEVKQELAASTHTDGSYMMNSTDPLGATTSPHVMSGQSYKNETSYGDDEILPISGPQNCYGGAAAPMSFFRQMLLPPSPDSFYSFIDTPSDLHLPSPTSHPFSNEIDTNYSTQKMVPSDPAVGHWLQHHQNNASFF